MQKRRKLLFLSLIHIFTLEDGRILWKNDSFSHMVESQKREKYLNKLIPELNNGVFPKDDNDHVELEVTYRERDYQVVLRRVSLESAAAVPLH